MDTARPVRARPSGAVVTVHLWTVPVARVPALLARTTAWRLGGGGPDFARLLGTTRPGRFDPRAAHPGRWLLLARWPDGRAAAGFERGRLAGRWRAAATETWRADLVPLSAHGRWAGREPFTAGGRWAGGEPLTAGGRWAGGEPLTPGGRDAMSRGPRTASAHNVPAGAPVLVLTRARLRLRCVPRFWRAMSRVRPEQPGLRLGFGIGEAPFGWQGTLSLWESAAAVEGFARGVPAHLAAMRAARQERWYAEEMFARLAVRDAAGTVDGRDPLR